jgi:hypothetical protein
MVHCLAFFIHHRRKKHMAASHTQNLITLWAGHHPWWYYPAINWSQIEAQISLACPRFLLRLCYSSPTKIMFQIWYYPIFVHLWNYFLSFFREHFQNLERPLFPSYFPHVTSLHSRQIIKHHVYHQKFVHPDSLYHCAL